MEMRETVNRGKQRRKEAENKLLCGISSRVTPAGASSIVPTGVMTDVRNKWDDERTTNKKSFWPGSR